MPRAVSSIPAGSRRIDRVGDGRGVRASCASGRSMLVAMITGLLCLSACNAVPYDERYPEVHMYDNPPNCDYEVLGRISAEDGHNPIFGQSKEWDTRANMAQARSKLRAEAVGLGADTLILTQRVLGPNESGGYRHIELRGVAITSCP